MASREERKRLAQFARNLAATRHLYRVSLVARVESEEDIPFWQHDFEYEVLMQTLAGCHSAEMNHVLSDIRNL